MVAKISATPLVALEEIAARIGVAGVWLKDESKNPFGTIKDRRSKVLIEEANRFKVDKLVLITSGNNGYSLARFASGTSIKVICVVNRRLDQNVKKILQDTSYQVIEHNLEHKILRPEETISFARETEDEVIWDATNGYEEAYSEVLSEILKDLPDVDYIVVPLGSGGIYMGFVQALEKSKSKARIIGIGAQNTSSSIADKLATPWTPYSKALSHHHKNGHTIFRLGEDAIKQAFMNYQHVIESEPSSAIVFGVFPLMRFAKKSKVVLVNSGKSILG
jgi:cysteine synthase